MRNFGIPAKLSSDNGNTFANKLWTNLQASLGTIVEFAPLYSPQAVGGVERQHQPLKTSLKAALLHMSDVHGSNWMSILPWILLARRTSFHTELTFF